MVLPLAQLSVVPTDAVGNAGLLAGCGAALAMPGPLFTFAAYLGGVMQPTKGGTGYSEALLGHRAQSTGELVALYGALLAHSTDADAKGVASMIPGLEPAQVTVAMRALEWQRTPASCQ